MLPKFVFSSVFLILLASTEIRGCPNGCKCNADHTRVTCRVPHARNIPQLRFPVNMTRLDLSGNNILNVKPGSLKSFAKLEELVLDGNKIYFLENGAFEGCENLQKISLANNNIHFIENEVFFDAKNLKELVLYNNELSDFPNLTENAQLNSLCVTSNKIKSIPVKALSGNSLLSHLSLKRNQLTDLPRNVFPKNVTSYTKLNLVGNNMKLVPTVIREMTELLSLSLCFNPIKVFSVSDFQPLVSLQNLSMTDVGMTSFPIGVFVLPSLQRLWLGQNKISRQTISNINFPELVELDLSEGNIDVLPEGFNNVPKLELLNLHKSRITGNIQTAFRPLSNLKCLNLCSNEIVEVPTLGNHDKLEKLNLNNNKLKLFPVATLSGLKNLKELRLSNNSLEEFNVELQSTMELLDLSYNNLTDLQLNSNLGHLKSLNISHNPNLASVQNGFTGLTNLSTLNLRGNNLTEMLPAMFSNLTNLKNLHLCHNQLREVNSEAMSGLKDLRVFTADGNQINTIEDDNFAKNQKLMMISLKENGLGSISNQAFVKLTKLEELWLLYNDLKIAPNITYNARLRILGLCNNPIGNLHKAALAGPHSLEVVLLRSMGLTELPRNVFGNINDIRVLNLALENNLTSVPLVVREMSALRVLKLTENPIRETCIKSFAGLNNLREIRLNHMKLQTLGVTKFFPALPALRTLYLAGNPWRCDCQLQWYSLGINGGRAMITTEDFDMLRCASPPRLVGKRFDFLRLGDFRQCVDSKLDKVTATSAFISLPFIGAFASDLEDSFHLITYVPINGGHTKKVKRNKMAREAQLTGLSPSTDYFVCTEIVTIQIKYNRTIENQYKESCFKMKTRSMPDDHHEEGDKDVSSSISRDLVIVYAVLGAAIGFVLLTTLVVLTVWCRRSSLQMRDHFVNISEISNEGQNQLHEHQQEMRATNGQHGRQSTPIKNDALQQSTVVSSGFPSPPHDVNGRSVQSLGTSGHVNQACDVKQQPVPRSARTKL